MPKPLLSCALLLLLLLTPHTNWTAAPHVQRPRASAPAEVPAPEDVLGFRPGDDRKLASWAQTVEYFRRLAAASPRVKFEELDDPGRALRPRDHQRAREHRAP